jgi:putative hydrolase of the HAD superfamily
VAAGQRRRALNLADLDAVTIDGYGTLLELHNPLGELRRLLPGHSPANIERAFRAEADYYVVHSHEPHDATTLAQFRAECTRVFNNELGSSLTSEEYNSIFRFVPLPGVREALAFLRGSGVALAVVANWDLGLHDHLAENGLGAHFDVVVTSGDARARKPDPTPFRIALERLGVRPERALHIGDQTVDEQGAAAAGMHFAPAPLLDAVQRWQ